MSTFHYFEDKQKLFLEKCKQIMNENSTLIAEIGVSQKHKEKIYVEKSKRGNKQLHYPNDYTFRHWIDEVGFVVKTTEKSVSLDSVPRFFYEIKN